MKDKFAGGNGWLMFFADAVSGWAVYRVFAKAVADNGKENAEIYFAVAFVAIIILWRYIIPIFINHGKYTADYNKLDIRCGPIYRSISYSDVESASVGLVKRKFIVNDREYFMCLSIRMKNGKTLKYWDYTGYMNDYDMKFHHFCRLCDHINSCAGGV